MGLPWLRPVFAPRPAWGDRSSSSLTFPQAWLPALRGQGLDLAPKVWNEAQPYPRPPEATQSAPHFHRFVPGGNQPGKVGKYEFGDLWSVLCNSVSIHKMSALSFPNGGCSLIFNVFPNKAVCQLWPGLVMRRSCALKFSPRKHFKSFRQHSLCWLLAQMVSFPPALPHSEAHPLGASRSHGREAPGSWVRLGCEHSNFVLASKEGCRSVVQRQASPMWLGLHPEHPGWSMLIRCVTLETVSGRDRG